MNYLIVAPKYELTVGLFYSFPIGLASITSVLKKNGDNIECLNANHYYETMATLLTKIIIEKNIDVVCSGGISPLFYKLKEIFLISKQVKPDIITIAGGGIITSEPKIIMEMMPEIDIGVIGEGEETILEISAALKFGYSLSKINGIIYRKNKSTIEKTPDKQPIKNLDSLPYPDYEAFEIEKYLDMQYQNDTQFYNLNDNPRIVPIIASRSCPYKCTFCFHPLGNKYRQYSLDYLFGLIEHLINKYNANEIALYDELFLTRNNKDKFIAFCNRIKNYKLQWSAQLRVDSVDEYTLNLARESGCTCISYGLESASNRILKSMKKIITVKQIEKALKLTYYYGLGIRGNFIFGDEEETLETAFETLNWWAKNKRYQISLSFIQPYPGTPLYFNALKKGMIQNKKDYMRVICPIINLTKMKDEEWEYIKKIVIELNYYHNLIPSNNILKCSKINKNFYKGSIYSLSLICPHCSQISNYSNMNIPYSIGMAESTHQLIYCKVCRQLFNTLPLNIEEKILQLNTIISNGKSAVYYKKGEDNHILFTLAINLLNKIDCIVYRDISETEIKFIKNLNKKILFHSDKSLLTLNYLIYPIYEYNEEDFDIISNFERQGIKVLKLYFFKRWQTAHYYVDQLIKKQNISEATDLLDYVRAQFFFEPSLENLEGELEYQKGNLQNALKIFFDAQKKWPQDWLSYNNIGVFYFYHGDITDSYKYLSYAKKLSPNNNLIDHHLRLIKKGR